MAAADDDSGKTRERVNPAALSIPALARLLSAAGGQRITIEMIEADLATGAPTNPDGTIHLVHYAAWLVGQSGARSPESAGAVTTRACDPGASRLQTPGYGLSHD